MKTRTIYHRGLNKRFSLKFQCISPEEGQSVQQPKHHEYHKDEDNSMNSIFSHLKFSCFSMQLHKPSSQIGNEELPPGKT